MPIAWEKNIDLVEDNMTEMGWPYLPQFNYHVRSKKIALYVQGKLNVVVSSGQLKFVNLQLD
jgi:hypothetical protein